MRNKIVRADGETIITEFKSFRYVEQVNEESNLRYGSVISSYIEAEVYGDLASAVSEGEELTYYQVFDTDNSFNPLSGGQTNEIKIGVFTATVAIPSKTTYKFHAYDNISKLDVDFSATLKAQQNNFPMSVANLVSLVASLTGVTFNISQCPLHYYGNDVQVNQFYSDGITARQIISYVAEVSSCNIYCLPNGTIYAQPYISNRSLTIPPPDFWWKDNYDYIICPTDTVTYTGEDSVGNLHTLIPVFYKENGFEKANYTCEALDTFSIRKTDGTNVWSMIGTNVDDVYEINSNPLVDFISLTGMTDWETVMSVVETEIESETLKGIVPFTIHLFPFRNPFRAGEFLPHIQGADGVRFRSLIMKMEITDSEVILYCYGNEKWHVSSQLVRTSDEMDVAFSAQINAIRKDVGSALVDIETIQSAINSAHIYFTPSELGLSGTPTMKDVVDAMPNYSIGCFDNNRIDQSALTQPFGDPVNVVVIFKYGQYRTFAVGARAFNNIPDTASRYAFASYNGSAWKGWYAIVKEQELRYQTNDTYVSTKSHLLYGIITGGSTNFVCDVVLPKTLENITGVTVTAMSGQIKGVLGPVDNLSQNTSFLSSPYSATAEKLDYNKIRITVRKNSAFTNTTNNSPATYWGSISLKFT